MKTAQDGSSPSRLHVKAHIFGGLGNQLFQFAAGRQLADRNHADLFLDLSRFNDRDRYKRQYSLDKFNLTRCDVVASAAHQPPSFFSRLARGASLLAPLHRRRLILERRPARYVPLDELRLRGSVTLDGYWQNERYFADIAQTLRREVTLSHPLSVSGGALLNAITATRNSVAVHVRRLHGVASGPTARPDPVSETKGLALTEKYYRQAIERIRSQVEDPEFFVFSDFDEWSRQTLSFDPSVHFVTTANTPDYEDLWLMAQCRHHVIANSSFSWWSAWLGEPKGGLIIAPTSAALLPAIPPRWVRVSRA